MVRHIGVKVPNNNNTLPYRLDKEYKPHLSVTMWSNHILLSNNVQCINLFRSASDEPTQKLKYAYMFYFQIVFNTIIITEENISFIETFHVWYVLQITRSK